MFDLWLFVSFKFNQSIILKTCFFLNKYNRHFFFSKTFNSKTNLFQQKTINQSVNQLIPFKNISLKKRSKCSNNIHSKIPPNLNQVTLFVLYFQNPISKNIELYQSNIKCHRTNQPFLQQTHSSSQQLST